jgi:hypothetical protein
MHRQHNQYNYQLIIYSNSGICFGVAFYRRAATQSGETAVIVSILNMANISVDFVLCSTYEP